MIYSYLKEKLDINNPEEYARLLREAEQGLDRMRAEFGNTWTYCCGCRGYAKVAEAYESTTCVEDYGRLRDVLRCGNCHSIWKFLD